ncbi:hypothetical protein RRF57_000003 [Xylaria bambusicola]|uniref:DUF7582 domain-containing protein n=1 Tax=Xylaria bambusicola TaxID=326684 RepID=A0AAN7YZ72_9PEZI
MGLSWSSLKQQHSAETLLELVPKRTPGHETPIPQFTRDTLLSAFSHVAGYIAKRGGDLTIVAIGGAVNTIHLQSRAVTHDVDFYNIHLTPEDYELLIGGAKDAVKKENKLEEDWFNNRTILFMPLEQRPLLTDEALKRHEIIFKEPGLTVLAPPWNYAFCCKVDRLAGSGVQKAREYDLDDAVQYLNQYLQQHELSRISTTTIETWFSQYLLKWNENVPEVLGRVNQTFRTKWHRTGDVIN